MSKISDRCFNEGKHEGTGHYWMCRRCRVGTVKGCADFKDIEHPNILSWQALEAIQKDQSQKKISSGKQKEE